MLYKGRTILILIELGLFVFIPFVLLACLELHAIIGIVILFISLVLLGIDIVFREIEGKGLIW